MNDGQDLELPKDSEKEDTHKKRSTTITPGSDNLFVTSDDQRIKDKKLSLQKLSLSLNHPELKIKSNKSSRKASCEDRSQNVSKEFSNIRSKSDDQPNDLSLKKIKLLHNDFKPSSLLQLKLNPIKIDKSEPNDKGAPKAVKHLQVSPESMHHSTYRTPGSQNSNSSPGKVALHDSSKTNKEIKGMILMQHLKRGTTNKNDNAGITPVVKLPKKKAATFDLQKLIQPEAIEEEGSNCNSSKIPRLFFPPALPQEDKKENNHYITGSNDDDDMDEKVNFNRLSPQFFSISPQFSPQAYNPKEIQFPFDRGITLGDDKSNLIFQKKLTSGRRDTDKPYHKIKSEETNEPKSAGYERKKSLKRSTDNKSTIYGGDSHFLKRLPIHGMRSDEDQLSPGLVARRSEQLTSLASRLEEMYVKAYPAQVTYVSFTGDERLLARVDTSNGNLLAIYQGSLEDGLPSGKGVLKYSADEYYSGEWVGGLASGHGDLITEGYTYTGEFLDGIFQGKGTLKIKGKGTYEGSFHEGKFHGKGKFSWDLDKKIYIGSWRYGVFHGKGLMIWPDGRKFYGEYLKGDKHGKGLCIFASGAYRYGNWNKGAFLGYLD